MITKQKIGVTSYSELLKHMLDAMEMDLSKTRGHNTEDRRLSGRSTKIYHCGSIIGNRISSSWGQRYTIQSAQRC